MLLQPVVFALMQQMIRGFEFEECGGCSLRARRDREEADKRGK